MLIYLALATSNKSNDDCETCPYWQHLPIPTLRHTVQNEHELEDAQHPHHTCPVALDNISASLTAVGLLEDHSSLPAGL